MTEKINFENKLKKQILIQKKYAIMEKAETDKYLKLKEQHVCLTYLLSIYNICKNLYKLFMLL